MLEKLQRLILEVIDIDLDDSIRKEFKDLTRSGISTEQIVSKISNNWDLPKEVIVDILGLKSYREKEVS